MEAVKYKSIGVFYNSYLECETMIHKCFSPPLLTMYRIRDLQESSAQIKELEFGKDILLIKVEPGFRETRDADEAMATCHPETLAGAKTNIIIL